MLPFLKDRHEGSASGSVEIIKREPDEGSEEDYGMLDAICEDMLDAMQKKDKKLLRGAIEALIEHIKEEDELQDMEDLEGEEHDNQ